jgi:hypothetical protein
MFEEKNRRTPLEPESVPHDVPLIVIEPTLVVTQDRFAVKPSELDMPFAAVPVIVTLPNPVADMLDSKIYEPLVVSCVTHEVPLTVIEPVLVVTQLLYIPTPHAENVPHAAMPVIVT